MRLVKWGVIKGIASALSEVNKGIGEVRYVEKKRVQLVELINLENPLVLSLHSIISTSIDIITNVTAIQVARFQMHLFSIPVLVLLTLSLQSV